MWKSHNILVGGWKLKMKRILILFLSMLLFCNTNVYALVENENHVAQENSSLANTQEEFTKNEETKTEVKSENDNSDGQE